MNNKEKVMRILFEESTKEFHIRLLARLTKLHPNTIISITDDLAKEGLIIKQKHREARLTLIRANTQGNLYKLKKRCYNVEKIHRSGLIDFLNNKLAYPAIILFGSYAKAENRIGSDVDLFVITEEKKKPDVRAYEEKLHAEVQLFIHTKREFNELKKTSPELINNVVNGLKLSGYLEVF